MATSPHVNGVAEIKTGTGSAGALELLGHSLDGVTLDFQDFREFVYADSGGGPGGIPIDSQEVGEICIISADLVVYDESVFTKIRKRPGQSTEGLMSTPGLLIGAGGYLYRLLITSPVDGLPWNFLTTFLRRRPGKVSTRRNIWNLQWFAFPYIGNSASALNAPLYNRVTTG